MYNCFNQEPEELPAPDTRMLEAIKINFPESLNCEKVPITSSCPTMKS